MIVGDGHLTGRWRYRAGWRGRLVLQCEYVETVDIGGIGNLGDDIAHVSATRWRDARVEDLARGQDYAEQ